MTELDGIYWTAAIGAAITVSMYRLLWSLCATIWNKLTNKKNKFKIPITMFSEATIAEQQYLKIIRQKDNLLFHILLLMKLDSEDNYTIDKKDKGVVDEAMALYVEPSTSKTLSTDTDQIEKDWMEQKDQCTAAWDNPLTEKEIREIRLRYGNPEVIFDDSTP
jgi:hypothetical protein